MAGTRYRVGGLSCGCIRSLTDTEVSAGEAGCVGDHDKPPKVQVSWVALPGVRVKPHRCTDGQAPPPPAPDWLPTLPTVRLLDGPTFARGADDQPIYERATVTALGCWETHQVTGIDRRPAYKGQMETVLLVNDGPPILPGLVKRVEVTP